MPLSPVMRTEALRGRDLVDLVEDALHRRALPDHLEALELLLGDARELALRLGRVEHVAHADEDALAGERLLEEVARPELDGHARRRAPSRAR